MILARNLASAARSCIQRCRQSRGGDLCCSCSSRPCSGEIDAVYLVRSGEELESFTNNWQPCLAGFVAWQVA
jgi:hypothetical protein